jgi:hypothetical protein
MWASSELCIQPHYQGKQEMTSEPFNCSLALVGIGYGVDWDLKETSSKRGG